MSRTLHQNLPSLPSNQKFGWFFSLVFALSSAYAYWIGINLVASALFVLAVFFALVAAIAPNLLAPLNHLWFKLGLLLGKIVSPIVLGSIFFLLITPVSLITRLFGRDALLLNKRNAISYWVDRNPSGPTTESFKDQF